MTYTVTVSADPSKFDFYRTIGLPVFEKTDREKIIEELEAKGIKYKVNSKTSTLKKKLNADTESDNKHGVDSAGPEEQL